MRARQLAIGVFVALCAVVGGLVVVPADRADALSGSEFDPGNIVSDEVMFSANAMTQGVIQSFLDAKIGGCENSLCLNVLRVDTPTIAAEQYCGTYAGVRGESAAAIIYKVQRACAVSAKVILVTLQKEQGLVTRTSPSDAILRKAMGMGCPDTSVCDAQYYGFFNQVYAAARQFHRYNNGSFTWYKVGQYNNIQWHPDASCGSERVLIRNKATAALYYYTPYQPNSAALANIGGSGDRCSSYGNRNFWAYFTNWFGSTQTEIGPAAIRAAHNAVGGAGGMLGAPTSDYIPMSYYGGGLGQAFASGSIYWTPSTGARYVTGSILPYYFSKNGAAGPLAWPSSDTISIPQNGGGLGQTFQNGSVYSAPSTGSWTVKAIIRDAYWAQNGSAGALGWPLAEESKLVKNGGGVGQAFSGGSIFAKTGGRAFSVSGTIRDRYFTLGGADGKLGWPTSSVMSIPQNSGGTGQTFDGGSVYSSSGSGTWEVSGGIRSFYFTLGGSSGQLGWPRSAETCTNGTCSQTFQNGVIAWNAESGAKLVSPDIEKAYADLGGATGRLGESTSGLLTVPQNGGGLAQVFKNGSIYSKSGAGTFAVSGGIRDAYFARGGAAGSLGWPTGAEVCGRPDGVCSQQFESGTLYWSAAGGGWRSAPQIEAAYSALGRYPSALGSSTSEVISIPQNGGGLGQAFADGSIYWAASTGGFAVRGGIRQFYFGLGGAAGSLGWPTSGETCGLAENACSQSFQGGTIVWSAASGGRIAKPEIESLYASTGGAAGPLGARTSGLIAIPQNGGGFGQAYVSGSIYSSAQGTWAVSGGIRAFYFAQGGAAGSLGWPTAAAQCGLADNGCSQTFQTGTVLWSTALGGRLK